MTDTWVVNLDWKSREGSSMAEDDASAQLDIKF